VPTYTDLSQVMRVLQSNSGEKIRFSSTSLVGVRAGKVRNENDVNLQRNTNLSFDYNLVEVDPSFNGTLTLRFYFSDTGIFKASRVDEKVQTDIYLSSGITSESYITPDGMVTVPPEVWTSATAENDVVELRFDSQISDDHANLYIEDAESMIDIMLESAGLMYLLDGKVRLFEEGAVPEQIRVCTTYLACYLIFTDQFSDVGNDKELRFSYPARWKKRAEDLLNSYIKAKGIVPPRVFGFPSFIDRVGHKGIGPGMATRTSDINELRRDAQTDRIFDP
jgi:hypothetical protein